jgi:hypothetical protein
MVYASWIGFSIAFVIFIAAMIKLLLNFKDRVLKLRRGEPDFPVNEVSLVGATAFAGAYISNIILGYFFTAILLTLVITPLLWPLVWKFMWE